MQTSYGLIPLTARDKSRIRFSSQSVAIDLVEGIQVSFDVDSILSRFNFPSLSGSIMDYISENILEQCFNKNIGPIRLTAHLNRSRFDRLRYGDKSLLNIIENQPVGVDGNYVAFCLAPNLRFTEDSENDTDEDTDE